MMDRECVVAIIARFERRGWCRKPLLGLLLVLPLASGAGAGERPDAEEKFETARDRLIEEAFELSSGAEETGGLTILTDRNVVVVPDEGWTETELRQGYRIEGRTPFTADVLDDQGMKDKVHQEMTKLLNLPALVERRESLSEEERSAEVTAVAETVVRQLENDYERINGYYVRMTGSAGVLVEHQVTYIDMIAQALINWQVPLWGEKAPEEYTLAPDPVTSGQWRIVDADTGESVDDDFGFHVTHRELVLIQKVIEQTIEAAETDSASSAN